jgi:riboflavin kinase/FMN adenylyltransferase
MRYFLSLEEARLENSWLTIGAFDGVHRGHQAVLNQLAAGAHKNGAPAVALTFHPHPAAVLRNRQGAFYLSSPEERARLLGQYGADVVIVHPFDRQVANLSAYEFIARLHHHLGLKHLCVGHDFALGRGREGNLARLQQLGEEFGYTVSVMEEVAFEGQSISSSQIRAALAEGDIKRANFLLGRPYSVSGEVVHGDGRGRTIDIPTANLDIWSERMLPQVGVYTSTATVGEETWQAVTNVGHRPTFDGKSHELRVETHLLDVRQDFYGRTIELTFIERLRDEQRFPNVQALVEQIQRDITRSRAILSI